ncbi:hypothetical protein AVEN_223314-2 [Araneus ventricosus]|uniref:Uncharacterized protein n=1 Tax=Araneus ventricosus TaxID=182803 RepID=A0A4Y2PA01_ARAVE|nr:hypothetical protein AVEN_223314-2 [Araneus ventricosus]
MLEVGKVQDINKSRFETEVDYYSNGINEIEAGDIRDDPCTQMRIPKISDSNTLKIFDVSKKPVRLKVLRNCHAKCFSHRDIKKLSNESSVEGSNEMDPNSKELDDTTYNKLWTMRGFGQAYHFWKESRRASSPALHAYLTYVTLPWHSIIADILDSRQHLQPILTF